MSFQWLQMRITEETDRREREAAIHERLPRAVEEIHEALAACIESYRKAFGGESAAITKMPHKIQVTVRSEQNGKWQPASRVAIVSDSAIPGFQVDKENGADPLIIEVGLLPGDRLSYRDRAKDQYINMEEVTRRILDRALFPNLKE